MFLSPIPGPLSFAALWTVAQLAFKDLSFEISRISSLIFPTPPKHFLLPPSCLVEWNQVYCFFFFDHPGPSLLHLFQIRDNICFSSNLQNYQSQHSGLSHP